MEIWTGHFLFYCYDFESEENGGVLAAGVGDGKSQKDNNNDKAEAEIKNGWADVLVGLYKEVKAIKISKHLANPACILIK